MKLCGTDEELRSSLPARWEVQPANHFMIATEAALDTKPVPEGYRMELHQDGPVTRAFVIASNGDLAASGCAAETADVFIYDRIETAQEHRRKGLGVAVMAALRSARKSPESPQLLVATEDGRNLYANLGWTVLAPFAAAVIPES
ncbi:GNAT family N-acetyltransferase [Lysobacter niastensis]|uniref:GNAT family N-acetyltransferase n=1 Tax=Lysobacter niastensis TaxID=380629 RepID=A0ABS0B8P0_9GAMM|nr:GNAT family N-acetyltransferase [Lysobacter niastensis]MBF6024019.1 GNAT family N-acetyltransferase [Lysobacter niastensis]